MKIKQFLFAFAMFSLAIGFNSCKKSDETLAEEFENTFEHDRFEIIFEKSYLKFVTDSLEKLITHKVVEIMPDGSESPENIQSKNLIKLISDLVENSNFENDKVTFNFSFRNSLKFYLKNKIKPRLSAKIL